MKKRMHMIGNAHLDPVWLWRWQEGFFENKMTLRSALDRLDEYEGFIFTASSARFFEWIEKDDPAMFERIRARVREGRLVLCGGWYIEPDCNIPSGESFIRQGLYAQNYFFEKFGRTAVTGYNVDSFGHNAMLPQILYKSGLKQYVFMRPFDNERHTETSLFLWEAPDGSRVLTYRLPYTYTANMNLPEHIEACKGYFDPGAQDMMCFYGVGNHGGGPTKRNIEYIQSLRSDEYEFVFSSPDRFFDAVRDRADSLPVERGCMLHHASGCYSAQSMVKAKNRESEMALYSAEAFCAAAEKIGNMPYPDDFDRAWKKVLFNQFHDILAGSGVKEAYKDAENDYGYALSVAAENQNYALSRIAGAVDIPFIEGAHNIVVFNPHAWEAELPVEIEGGFHDNSRFAADLKVVDSQGREMPFQRIAPNSLMFDRNLKSRKLLFNAKLPAFGYELFQLCPAEKEKVSQPEYECGVDRLENEFLIVAFDKKSGGIRSIYDKKLQKELLSGIAFAGDVFRDDSDTWSHFVYSYPEKIGAFSAVRFEPGEHGAEVCSVRIISEYGKSRLTQEFSLRKGRREVEVSAKVDYYEPHTAFKLCLPCKTSAKTVQYEIPFSHFENADDGKEFPSQGWISLEGENCRLSLLARTKTAASYSDGILGLTVLRTPPYGHDMTYELKENEIYDYMDFGSQEFSYLLKIDDTFDEAGLAKRAREFQLPAIVCIEGAHAGALPKKRFFVEIDHRAVIVSACKKALDGQGYILRLYEAEGKSAEFTVNTVFRREPVRGTLGPYEIRTYRIVGETVREESLTELG